MGGYQPNHFQNSTENQNVRPKVKFSSSSTKNGSTGNKNGISFRKSHNGLPIMHPDEIEAIQHSKKKKKNLYKQRASYSAAHSSKNKNQLLQQSKIKIKNHNGINAM